MGKVTRRHSKIRLLNSVLYVAELIEKKRPGYYFPTGYIKTYFKKKGIGDHGWWKFKNVLISLENKNLIESINTTNGTMWRLKNDKQICNKDKEQEEN